MNISLSPFAPDNLVSRGRFGSPVPRQLDHLHTKGDRNGVGGRDGYVNGDGAGTEREREQEHELEREREQRRRRTKERKTGTRMGAGTGRKQERGRG